VILAGVAVGLGLGVKLTTALVLPVIVLLAIRLGRRRALGFAMATGVTFAALGAWSFVLNLVETGHVLGHGGGRVEQTASPSLSGGLTTGRKVLLHLIDRSGFEVHVIEVLVLVALCGVAALVTILRHRGRSWGSAFTTAGVFALSLLAPIFVAGLAVLNKRQPSPVHLGSLARINERVNEDVSSFGPLGLVLIGVCVLTMGATLRRRSDAACRLILALALPLFLVILALTSRYNPWLSRFLIVPALAAPLFGPLFSRRSMTLGIVVVAATTLGLALVRKS